MAIELAVMIGFATLVASRPAHADDAGGDSGDETACAPLTDVRGRWENDAWQPLNEKGDAPSGRAARDRLEVHGTLPSALPPSPALAVASPAALVGYSVGGESRAWSPHAAFALPLSPSDAGRDVVLRLESRGKVSPGVMCVTTNGTAVAHALRTDLAQFVVGAVLCLLGAIFVAATVLRRQRTPEYLWLGVFALPLGSICLAQATAFRVLLGGPTWIWYAFSYAATFIHPIGLAQYVRLLFGDTRRRLLHWCSIAIAAAFVLATILDVTDVVRLSSSRRIAYLLLFVIGVTTLLRARVHRASAEARVFLGGFALLFVFALPDVLWGFGYPLVRTNVAQYGILVFALTLASILELRFRSQRAALQTSTRTAEERAEALAENQRTLESVNEELRHQVEARSRELVLALSGDRTAPPVKEARIIGPGDVFGSRYLVVKELGAGAMGAVYLVERRTDKKRFALKTALGTVTPEGAARMAREAEIAAKIRHPHLVSVIDVGLETGTPFLVMEYVEGCTVADRRERFGDVTWALPLLHHIALGLDALHAHGIIHRDLKPANVLLTMASDGRERAKISDFGIARFGRDDAGDIVSAFASTIGGDGGGAPLDAKLTATGAVMGTPLYMAPESAKSNARITVASDVFAFGLVAYELLAGAYPYLRPPALSALSGLPIEPVGFPDRDGVPPAISAIIGRALAVDPGARPSAKDLVGAFGPSSFGPS